MKPNIHFNLLANDYAASFALDFKQARAINRHHHFYVGPTNSGKTYHAFNALIAAKSGVYLAPLRLLAMEVRDKLIAAGVPCNLITGEERDIIDGAQHTASTIEMMNPNKLVDVAIIDEIQMLQDPDRGSAWTAALVGVPARQVFVCGSNAVTAPCLQVIESLNETVEITHLQRMTPLVLEDESLCGKRYSKPKLKPKLQKGDAIIVFSRKDVLTFSARFKQWGFTVASIYGALSPEVRRHESERFCTGQADILVATDAIGMGLNLPIRRVIFSAIHKFDGVAARLLNATEVRQIAGRAGRFGIYETGFVSILEDDERFHIEHMLATDDTSELTKLPIAPNFNQLAEIAEKMHTAKLAECLEYFAQQLKFENALFALSNVATLHAQALLVDEFAPKMALKDKFIFACAPISINTNIEKDYFLMCLQSAYLLAPRALPAAPHWLDVTNPKHFNSKYLQTAENLSQNISLYAWLSFKFSQVFTDGNSVKAFRNHVSKYIENALLTQAGYGQTAREADILKH
ncbi:MAG: helicase [Bdellovibrio sp.]|nr:helicase [Methylotenera sp.]